MPKKVKHYILIKYEDLINNFDATMNRIKKEGKLEVSPDISFPKNIYTYKAVPDASNFIKKNEYPIPRHKILTHPNLNTKFEKHLKYI